MGLSISNKCNLSCTYCYHKELYPNGVSESTIKDIDQIEKNIDWFHSQLNGEPGSLVLGSKEALMETDKLQHIFEYIEKNGYDMRVRLATNGIMLQDARIKALYKKYTGKWTLTVSIDGKPESQNTHRIIDPSQQKREEIDFKAIADYYHSISDSLITVSCTISKETVGDMFDNIKYIRSLGYPEITIGRVSQQDFMEVIDVYLNQLEKVGEWYLNKFERNDHELTLEIFDNLYEVGGVLRGKYCGAGFRRADVTPGGVLIPCVSLTPDFYGEDPPEKYIMGKVGGDKFKSLFKRSLPDKCLDCEAVNSCIRTTGFCGNFLLAGLSDTACEVTAREFPIRRKYFFLWIKKENKYKALDHFGGNETKVSSTPAVIRAHIPRGILGENIYNLLEPFLTNVSDIYLRCDNPKVMEKINDVASYRIINIHDYDADINIPLSCEDSGCISPYLFLGITSNGLAYCCPEVYNEYIGDLQQQTIEDIWNGPEILLERQRLLEGQNKCKACARNLKELCLTKERK